MASADGRSKRKAMTVHLAKVENRLRRETPFNYRVQFRNDLPPISCDPKILLPPLNPKELAAFSLTSLERGLKRDLLFEEDLGIPIGPLAVQRYALPEGAQPNLDPADAALLQSDDEATGKKKGRHAAAPEVSWLLRTSYLTSGGGPSSGRRSEQGNTAAAAAAAAEADLDDDAARIAAIEESFAAAEKPPVHATNPELTAVEILPVLPDDEEGPRNFVMALFDSDPVADLAQCARMGPEGQARVKQAVQLKSFAQRRPDGSLDRFVAMLLPRDIATLAARPGPVAAVELQTDYDWVREYNSAVRYDEKGTTFLFRKLGDSMVYSDLNTKLALRKRKRAQVDVETFLQPEKITLRVPGGDDEPVSALHDEPVPQHMRGDSQEAAWSNPDTGAFGEAEAEDGEQQQLQGASLRNAWGSDDDDDDDA